MPRLIALIVGAVVVLAGCGSAATPADPSAPSVTPSAVPSPEPDAPSLPSGWRWESYGGVEIGVPARWTYGTTGSPWCLHDKPGAPYVGRPGAVAAIGCLQPSSKRDDPAMSVGRAGSFVWFSPADQTRAKPSPEKPAVTGDREVLTVGDVVVAVQAEADLRRRIVRTVHAVTVDASGCPVRSPGGRASGWRPEGPAITALTGVTSVSACKYAGAPFGGLVVSSLRLTGPAATGVVEAMAAAPVGSGPDASPSNCAADPPTDKDVLVATVVSAAGASRVVVDYDGCRGHGIDDGHSMRRLTRPAVAPLMAGPNLVSGFADEALARIVRP